MNRRGGFNSFQFRSTFHSSCSDSGSSHRPTSSSSSTDYSQVCPPSNINKPTGYSLDDERGDPKSYGKEKRKQTRMFEEDEESYWDQDDDDNGKQEISDCDGDSRKYDEDNKKRDNEDDEDEEEDPLDAFMAGIEKQVNVDSKKKEEKSNVRLDIEEEDVQESYYRYMEENPRAGLDVNFDDDDDEIVEYDEQGNPIVNRQKLRYIDPLPACEHSKINYKPFERNFYHEHDEIQALDEEKTKQLRTTLGITVSGANAPKPCISFAHFGFDEQLTKAVIKAGYHQPTPIQCQAIPIALSGRDVLGVAKTGSGKTAAYLWPMLVHIMDQRELRPGEGPIGLILAPTRELSQQIHTEAKKFAKVYGLRVACCFGGGSKWEQSNELSAGAEIVVATPGRMIDMVKCKATNLERVTMLVLDEADRMFDMGFGIQIRSLCDHTRHDRQTLLFSATFKRKVERLARHALTDPIKVVQGELGVANEDVTQSVLVMTEGPSKWLWLTDNLVKFTSSGSVLIFVTKKTNSEELAANLKERGFDLVLIHGDMHQTDRNKAISTFKKQEVNIMVATDVAARGLDISHVRTVINYDVARDIDTHTHRIGRTGRAGDKTGIAYTLITEKDKDFAGPLVRNLEGANQFVPKELMDLAMQSNWFAKSRFKQGKGKRVDYNNSFQQRSRPGLGSDKHSLPSSSIGEKSSTSSSSSSFGYNEKLVSSSTNKFDQSSSNRVSAIKAAFKTQFQSNFKSSSDSLSSATSTVNSSDKSSTNQLYDSTDLQPRKKSLAMI
ncbi:ATP-dependent RNA helicase DDX42-like [Panonychus citri]|uniref:ATP-dependent RNA helicase DDX42-like n=1 Tax=Panonychus citri TaxID=50023 RepID=UPI002306FBFD|nr:ATP-dependent RNA helicase DDX42-like [Panonychus citri]